MYSKTPESIVGTGSYNDLWTSYYSLREDFKDELDSEFTETMYCIDAPGYIPCGSVYALLNVVVSLTVAPRQS